MKKNYAFILLLITMTIVLSACHNEKVSTKEGNTTKDLTATNTTISDANATTIKEQPIEVLESIPLTEIQKQKARYVAIDEIGSYNKEIITDDSINSCSLPTASKEALPYWTGTILENKISTNFENDQWDEYREAENGSHYYLEEEIKYLSENGFNCARVLLSFSFFSNPDDVNSINESELEQIDELISWGLKYNVHIMLSITGMPGKNNTSWDDEVQNNSLIFTDSEMETTFAKYWSMLAKRYREIPANVLSFELVAEPSVPDGNLDLYSTVLGPIAQDIWTYNNDRIIIVNDVWRNVPEQLAALGCCLSLHNHIFTVDSRRLEDLGITYDPIWPMQYLPEAYSDGAGNLILKSDVGFQEGTLIVYYNYAGNTFAVSEDGALVSDSQYYEVTDKMYESNIDITAGTKEIAMKPNGNGQLLAITIKQEGKENITIPTHALYAGFYESDTMPTIMIHSDGSLENIDSPQKLLNADYLEEAYLKKFMDCASTYGVSFLMTEIGTDTLDLSPEEYVAYHSTWLEALSKNHISWMYNCTHNILAPTDMMWLNATNSKFTDFSNVEYIPRYMVNNSIMDMLKSYE